MTSLGSDLQRLVLRMPDATRHLTGPQREVLALLAERGFGYAEIGALLGLEPLGVAEIAARGRLRLLPGPVPEPAPRCAEELPWLAAIVDAETLPGPGGEHNRRCAACQANLEAMRLADVAYRGHVPAPMARDVRDRIRAGIEGAERRGPDAQNF